MNILLLGNGFDLAHKLPTQYKDFLEFCEKARRIYTDSASTLVYQRKCIEKWDMDIMVKGLLKNALDNRECISKMLENGMRNTEVSTPNKSLNELYTLVKNNLWLEYFYQCQSYVGENWIDFESEISRVIQVLDNVRKMTEQGKNVMELDNEYTADILKAILKASHKEIEEVFKKVKSIDEFVSLLDIDLKRMIRALEIYLTDFVGKIAISVKIPEIESLKPDHVLSFNYTDTYEKIYGYGKTIKYDYVHGKAKIDNTVNSNNMVLGIDEYLPKNREKEIEFVSFKKYYQRIFKETGSKYLDWVGAIAKQYEGECVRGGKTRPYTLGTASTHHQITQLSIFGHSLDETDKDILQSLICNDNVHTVIYYLNDKVHARQVANLVKVIGPDELIRRTGGPTKTIEFVRQK